jgi:hypothetical protein
MSEVLVQQKIKLPNDHQREFLRSLRRWQGAASSQELGPQTSQAENSARQTCKRRGWVTYDRHYWRLTYEGSQALKAALAMRQENAP